MQRKRSIPPYTRRDIASQLNSIGVRATNIKEQIAAERLIQRLEKGISILASHDPKLGGFHYIEIGLDKKKIYESPDSIMPSDHFFWRAEKRFTHEPAEAQMIKDTSYSMRDSLNKLFNWPPDFGANYEGLSGICMQCEGKDLDSEGLANQLHRLGVRKHNLKNSIDALTEGIVFFNNSEDPPVRERFYLVRNNGSFQFRYEAHV
jgi:hypothetical protein